VRLPFPERVPLFPTLVFALVLCSLQQLESTSVLFSTCTFGFILIAAIAFNIVGGLSRPSGGYIFAYTLLVVLIGVTYKVIVGEPGQSNLQQPDTTILVYLGTITSMLVAAYLSKRFRLKKSLIPQFKSDGDLGRASLSCLVVGVVALVYGLTRKGDTANGSFFSAFQQLNAFLPLAIVLGVVYKVRASGGKRSFNLAALLSLIISFFFGVVSYSKQGMFTPFVCWFIAAASQRYKVSVVQIGGILLAIAFVTYYLVPYSQFGRTYYVPEASFSQNFKSNVFLLSNLGAVRKAYNASSAELYTGTDYSRYYNDPQGLVDRLQMITPDDLIISYTENGGTFGLAPTLFSYENLIPHFLWKDKPTIQFGNIYAHEIGILPDEDDVTTGISFSPSGDAFHQARWSGIFLLLPVLLFVFFVVLDSFCGDCRTSPIALIALIGTFHAAPEGGVTEIIRGPFVTTGGTWIVACIVVYLMPLMANLLAGPARNAIEKIPHVASRAGRFRAAEAAEQGAE
jgi:hypothetical protein